MIDKQIEAHLERVTNRYEEIANILGSGIIGDDFIALSKEFAELEQVATKAKQYHNCITEYAQVELMLQEARSASASDQGLIEMLEQEKDSIKSKIESIGLEVKTLLLPKCPDDSKNVMLEIRAGTGGEEAALFAADLLQMYKRYSEKQGWQFEILSANETGLGGYKELLISIAGKNAFAKLKFESGVHRIQRVPETESSGRIHTSAATVAVLPEVQEIDISIDEKDLKIETCRASGAGGQHVNTTDSAVRIVHKPTGLVVTQQSERSQHQNKAKAMKILRARLYDLQKTQIEQERADTRKSQVKSGDRSDKIRTYNFPQNRMTDHRINMTIHSLDIIMREGSLDQVIEALTLDDEANRLNKSDEGR